MNLDANPMKNKHHKIELIPVNVALQITMMGSNCICAVYLCLGGCLYPGGQQILK